MPSEKQALWTLTILVSGTPLCCLVSGDECYRAATAWQSWREGEGSGPAALVVRGVLDDLEQSAVTIVACMSDIQAITTVYRCEAELSPQGEL